jgi:cold-inducible RNA-binding protein
MKSIFVGNLDSQVVGDDLRQLFLQYGRVDRITVMTDHDTGRSRGFGFVDMAKKNEAEKAITELNGTLFAGRALNVNEARPQSGTQRRKRT